MMGTSFRHEPEALQAFRGTSYELIPLHAPDTRSSSGKPLGKAPLGKGWRTALPLSIDEAGERMLTGANVGVRLRAGDLVVDVDPRNFEEGDQPLERLAVDLGLDLSHFPTVRTGSGGFHVYMRIPLDFQPAETLDAYKGLEFKSEGRQVVAPGSVHPGTRGTGPFEAYRWASDPLAASLREEPMAPLALIERIGRSPRTPCADGGRRSPEQLEVMLEGLDPCAFGKHDKWLELMMACHHATAAEGREEFVSWSIGDPAYADHRSEIGARWDSLHADKSGRRITEKTLFKALVDAGREDLLPQNDAALELGAEGGSEWVWVADAEQFVRRGDTKKFSQQQWKSLYGSRMPDADIVTAVQRGKFPMRKFESLVYVPEAAEMPDGESGARYNIWRSSGVDASPGDVGPFLDHLVYLLPNETERQHVLDYMALLVQRPAEKIHFALLVRGRQGTGKSWIGQLMARIIGDRNVVRPSNDEVTSKWTAWMEGCQLGLIEELMTVGRMDVANRLKTVITEPTLRIENKGSKLYSIPNHLNLICFTNHGDALPIEHGDRRWLVVFSPAEPREGPYYDRLFDFLQGAGPAAVKHWLLERQVRLNPRGRAPATRGKEEMRRMSLSDAETYLLELFEERRAPFDFDLVRLEDVQAAVPLEIGRRSRRLRSEVIRLLRSEIEAFDHTRYTKNDGRPALMLWSVRDHEKWKAMGACRSHGRLLGSQREGVAVGERAARPAALNPRGGRQVDRFLSISG